MRNSTIQLAVISIEYYYKPEVSLLFFICLTKNFVWLDNHRLVCRELSGLWETVAALQKRVEELEHQEAAAAEPPEFTATPTRGANLSASVLFSNYTLFFWVLIREDTVEAVEPVTVPGTYR